MAICRFGQILSGFVAVHAGTSSRRSMIVRNTFDLHLQTRQLEMEIEFQRAVMRVAAAHVQREEEAHRPVASSVRELLERLRSQPAVEAAPEPEAV
jgi:hypothetical protein